MWTNFSWSAIQTGITCACTVCMPACSVLRMMCNSLSESACAGDPDGRWNVDLPAEEVPAELPEPCLGINFARDGMARKEWLALVAVHSDAWLMSVAFYYGAKLNGEQRYAEFYLVVIPCKLCRRSCTYRRELFSQLNNDPTLFEIVTGKVDRHVGSKRARSSSTVRNSSILLICLSLCDRSLQCATLSQTCQDNDFSFASCEFACSD